MKFYFSGWQSSTVEREKRVLETGAIKHRCFSFAMIKPLPGLIGYSFVPHLYDVYKLNLEHGSGIMMDSGAVSYRHCSHDPKRRKKLLPEDDFCQAWVDFAKKNGRKWDFYFTLDLKVDAPDILRRHCILETMGIRPTPVMHGDGDVSDYMKQYHDKGYDLIGIASPPHLRTNHRQRRRFLDVCFNAAAKLNIRLHGLAMTAVWQMLSYPYYSVDSSSWSRAATTGCIIEFDEYHGRMSTLHVSDQECRRKVELGVSMSGKIREHVKAKGFDYKLLSTDLVERHKWNAMELSRMALIASKTQRTGFNSLF